MPTLPPPTTALDATQQPPPPTGVVDSSSSSSCLIQPTPGPPIRGFISPSHPHVRQYLGIPFAAPPLGPLRFSPPVPPAPPCGLLSATRMPPAPMQAFTTRPDMYAKHVPEFLASGPYSEDCLYLNVFAPVLEETGGEEEGLPTVVFFYGGEGEWGGVNAEYSQPVEWVERSQGHIVVLFNWRVGVFGFPNAKGLSHGPLGLLDQRLALEFLRTNIHLFGGSPSRLIAYGHAAGSGSIEAHLFAWPDDPIVSGAICMSGFLPMGGTTRDMERKSWSLLARRLGCPDDASPEEEVEFMRGIDAGAILGCFRAYNDSDDVETKMFFRPQVDGRVLFTPEELGERARRGEFAKVPMLLGMTAQEGTALVPCRELAAGQEDAVAAAAKWNSRIEDALQQTLEYRIQNGRTTYRCLYAGDFANISPKPWMKAYHFSELPMVMGTHEIERGPSTDFQRQLSGVMQDMWLDFARDPERGLKEKWGWEPASGLDSEAMVLGGEGVLFRQGNKSKTSGNIVVVEGKREE